MTDARATAAAPLEVPDDPLALRARRHAYASAIAQLKSTPWPGHPIYDAWEFYREAWAKLDEATQARVDEEFSVRHRCKGTLVCSYAARVA